MVKIVIENLGKKEVPINDFSLSVLHHLQAHYIDWMHGCGGKGRCTSCKMIVVQGLENVTLPSPSEVKYQALGALNPSERLTCQARVTGSIIIRAPEEYKLPHVHYTE